METAALSLQDLENQLERVGAIVLRYGFSSDSAMDRRLKVHHV